MTKAATEAVAEGHDSASVSPRAWEEKITLPRFLMCRNHLTVQVIMIIILTIRAWEIVKGAIRCNSTL